MTPDPRGRAQANSTTCALLYERALEWLRPENAPWPNKKLSRDW